MMSTIRKIILSAFILLMCLSYGCGNCNLGSNSKRTSDIRHSPRIYEDISVFEKPQCTAPEIKVKQGFVCGSIVTTPDGKKVNAYLGIPYAEPTGGKNRWRPPVGRAPWEGTFRATLPGPSCPQASRSENPQSEDCLSINVWAPAEDSTAPRAVMVFIYGGSFIYGSNSDPLYNGAYTAAYGDVVVVNMNYRLGALGFLAGVKDKKTGEEINGNFGMLDQISALEWVRDNIGAFGGDPDKVTVFGDSAGAMSVGLHMLSSPRSEHLFRAGIITSNPLGLPYRNMNESRPIAEEFASNLGCPADDIECMRAKRPEAVLQAQRQTKLVWTVLFHGIRDTLVWAPVIDGEILTEQPIQAALRGKLTKPLIIGTTSNEALIFVEEVKSWLGWETVSDFDYRLAMSFIFRDRDLRNRIYGKYPPGGKDNTGLISKILTEYLFTCPSLDAALHASRNTWSFVFEHIPSFNFWPRYPACADKVCHSAEISFVFHTPEGRGNKFTPQENALSDLMVGYWTDFSKHLNPNSSVNAWPEFLPDFRSIMFVTPVDDIKKAGPGINADCKFWDGVGYNPENSIWGMF